MLQIIRKDFLPIALHDGCFYREFSVRYSYTGKEFDSIWGYLVSNSSEEYWATEEDVLEIVPASYLSEIDDATKSAPRQKIIDIFNKLMSVGEDIDIAIERIQNFTKDPIVVDYIIKCRDNYYSQ